MFLLLLFALNKNGYVFFFVCYVFFNAYKVSIIFKVVGNQSDAWRMWIKSWIKLLQGNQIISMRFMFAKCGIYVSTWCFSLLPYGFA